MWLLHITVIQLCDILVYTIVLHTLALTTAVVTSFFTVRSSVIIKFKGQYLSMLKRKNLFLLFLVSSLSKRICFITLLIWKVKVVVKNQKVSGLWFTAPLLKKSLTPLCPDLFNVTKRRVDNSSLYYTFSLEKTLYKCSSSLESKSCSNKIKNYQILY